MIGTTLGPYEITARLGEGGMGEVYRATDTRLGRQTALKLLPDDFATEPERHARFEREAKLLAALNHPNIATLYGVEHLDGKHALVMELVEGEDLSALIERGPLPLAETLAIARQIAEALEAAHEKGIVHRDLKPANVKVRADGAVKVLDFGLAKAMEPIAASSASDAERSPALMNSPTLTVGRGTQLGMILGTAAYMAPEQARGSVVDKRADIWSFGVVLYEMLTGVSPFGGETATDSIAAVLRSEPDWREATGKLGEGLVAVLRGCLAKDRRQRLSSARDVGLLLERAVHASVATGSSVHAKAVARKSPLALGVAVALVGVALVGVAIAAGIFSGVRFVKGEVPRVRLSIVDPDIVASAGFAISPDGSRIAFVLGQERGDVLATRSLDDFDAVAIPGTEGALCPFFSPDGQWVGYFTHTELRKVALSGGSHRTIARIAGRVRFDPWSASSYPTANWGEDDTIVFSSGFWREPSKLTGLFTVPGSGGEPEPLTTLDGTEIGHRWPRFVPGGSSIVFTAVGQGPRNEHVEIVERGSGRRQRLQANVANGRVVERGFLVSLDNFYSRLVAARIDTPPRGPASPGAPLIEGLSTAAAQTYDVSHGGTLAYLAAGTSRGESRLVRVGFDGTVTILVDRTGSWFQPRVSPDGRRLVVREVGDECRLWTFDLSRRTLTPLTRSGDNHQPVWARSGRTVAFGREQLSGGVRGLFRAEADGSGQPEELLSGASSGSSHSLSVPYPNSFSPGDRELLFEQSTLETGSDLWVLPEEGGVPVPFLVTPAFEGDGTFSPDGRWVAYVSDESGRQEVYVAAYPGQGGRVQVSVVGGEWPLWSPDGSRLYYSHSRRLMAADIDGGGTEPIVGRPQEVLRGFAFGRGNLDILPDGKSFVLVQPATPGVTEVRVITGWTRELVDAVPRGRRP